MSLFSKEYTFQILLFNSDLFLYCVQWDMSYEMLEREGNDTASSSGMHRGRAFSLLLSTKT
jgi:hypothetical protein